MHRNMRVEELASEVLARQARALAQRTGEPFEAALAAVLETEAGRQLGELGDGAHRGENAGRWQEGLQRERAEKRIPATRETRERVLRLASR